MKLWTDDGRRTTDDVRRTDGRTDGRRTTEPAYTISSPGAFGSGELKIIIVIKDGKVKIMEHDLRKVPLTGLCKKCNMRKRFKEVHTGKKVVLYKTVLLDDKKKCFLAFANKKTKISQQLHECSHALHISIKLNKKSNLGCILFTFMVSSIFITVNNFCDILFALVYD